MTVTDPIADMICVMKNAWRVKKDTVLITHSHIKTDIIKLLQQEGFISRYELVKDDNRDKIKVYLKYNEDGQSIITDMVRRSTPGKREYLAKQAIPKIKSGFGVSILTTNKGVLTGKQARMQNVGGEMLCHIWQMENKHVKNWK